MTNSPIIFIHYGASPYLYYTLRCAKKFNPGKQVILLGDAYNKVFARWCGVDFYPMKDWAGSAEMKRFKHSYRFIAGEKHGRPVWTNFVFRRWFILHDFLRAKKIQSFWTFDSDTMILADLSAKENYFSEVDNTEQCGGRCLNGYIRNYKVVDGYIHSMLSTLEDRGMMDQISSEITRQPDYAFTEMKAYEIFKAKENFRSVHLVQFKKNETFDDCICFRDGMEISTHQTGASFPKKVFTDGRSLLFRDAVTGEFIIANTINMSWVPVSYFERIYDEAVKINKSGNSRTQLRDPSEIELHKTSWKYHWDSILFLLVKLVSRIKRFFLKDEVIR